MAESKPPTPQKKKPNSAFNTLRLALFWILIILIGAAVFSSLNSSNTGDIAEKNLSEVLALAKDDKLEEIIVRGNELIIKPKEDTDLPEMVSMKDPSSSLQEQGFASLVDEGKVDIRIEEPENGWMVFLDIAIYIIPIIAIAAVLMYMMRQAQGMNNQTMGFGKSKARLYAGDKKKITFADVAGNEAAKQDLYEIVDFLKKPKKYETLGAKIPRGVLLAGDPGTGKTLMARAVAGEASVPFFSISGSEFAEMFVGVGASRVRDLFAKAKKNAPSIIFIDEIDAVAHKRDARGGAGREDEQTLNQILVEMDGFDNDTGVIVMAATNRVDMLDKALLRPGRFDRHVTVALPERKDRLEILKVHFKNKPVDSSIDLEALAAKTAGSSGADLANIANEAAITAARVGHKTITNSDLTEAFERVAIGPERKSKVLTDEEKKITAYHEAGHAVVGHVLPDSDPVHKVTIIPRGRTGGVTWFLPETDKSYKNIYELKDVLARAMGGRIAEMIIFGKDGVTTGASSDLKNASMLAREMVTEEGMGTSLRNQVFNTNEVNFFGDRAKAYSEKTAELIDKEIEKLTHEATARAEAVLKANKEALDILAGELLKKETLEEDEVRKRSPLFRLLLRLLPARSLHRQHRHLHRKRFRHQSRN
ncbi:ATP-dependent zinc metalloprotease FtsH [Christensenellaceae bacterium OttesenSCG-928-L17]|nr:ATP-dependent zinc metalloprotease FtsH [Christensenellaceae bacterium OttesenSCG-928-L17]